MPKTSEQFAAIRKERRDTILESALFLFATKGFEGANMDDVSKVADCSHGLLYHYFSSKQELFDAVVNEKVIPTHLAISETVNFNQKAKFVIHDLILRYFEILKGKDDRAVWAMTVILYVRLNSSMWTTVMKTVKSHKPIQDWILELIVRGQAEGDFNNLEAKDMVFALLALVVGLCINRQRVGYRKFSCPNAEIVMKMFLK